MATELALILADSRVAAIMTGPEETRHVELAKLIGGELCGFTDDDEKYIDMFWNPTFNDSWMYVTEEMVEHQMGYTRSKSMMSDFYTRKMMELCEEGVDYKQVDKNHPLVLAYSAALRNRKETSNRKLHYIISGEAFKDLLQAANTERGKATRKYYRKVERLSALTMRVLLAIGDRENERLSANNQRLSADNQRLAIEEKESARKADAAADGFATLFVKQMSFMRDTEQRMLELDQREQELKQRALRLRQMEMELELDRKRREHRTR